MVTWSYFKRWLMYVYGADDDDEVQILGEVKILSGRKKGDGNSFETKKKGDDEDFVDLRPKKTPKPARIRSLKF